MEQIEYGILANPAGVPIAVRVFPGNTADPSAFIAIATEIQDLARVDDMVMVGDRGPLQMSLFDEQNLAEISHPDYPGEQLIACYNPAVGRMGKHKRAELLDATEERLKTSQRAVIAGRLKDAGKTGLRVGKTLGKNNMAKHFFLTSADNTMDAAEAVRVYKSLGERGEDVQIPQIPGSEHPSDLPAH